MPSTQDQPDQDAMRFVAAVAWDAAKHAQRQDFVKLRGVEIGQADPFAVPTFLRRAS